jgi:cysteine desulfurase
MSDRPGSAAAPGGVVYLDHNATTPPHDDALAAMAEASREGWANPSSLHRAGRMARRLVDDAREAVAALCGESARDVVFTSGGTEANNLGVSRVFPGGTGLLVTSRLEHPSVLSLADELRARGVRVVLVLPSRSGLIEPGAIAEALASRGAGEPALVAVHAVHHETGAIQPVAEIIAAARAAGASVHVDAVQAAGRVAPSLWRGADTVALAAHKLRGPKGIGAVVSRAGALVRPILRGGSQERGLRPGTVDAIAAAGFGVAARRALEGGPERYEVLRALRDRAERSLVEAGRAVGVEVEPTVGEPRAPHVSHLLVEGFRGDELVAALDLEGVCVSSGSACAAGTAEPSPAIASLVGPGRAAFALRVSLGETTSASDIDALERAFHAVIARAGGRA